MKFISTKSHRSVGDTVKIYDGDKVDDAVRGLRQE